MLDQKETRDQKSDELPTIPDKLYFSIGEVGELCGLKPHVLRYWEQEFLQLSPTKRKGNRRYYQREDVLLVREIRSLLYEQGFTIEGARSKLMNEKSEGLNTLTNHRVKEIISDLEITLSELDD